MTPDRRSLQRPIDAVEFVRSDGSGFGCGVQNMEGEKDVEKVLTVPRRSRGFGPPEGELHCILCFVGVQLLAFLIFTSFYMYGLPMKLNWGRCADVISGSVDLGAASAGSRRTARSITVWTIPAGHIRSQMDGEVYQQRYRKQYTGGRLGLRRGTALQNSLASIHTFAG